MKQFSFMLGTIAVAMVVAVGCGAGGVKFGKEQEEERSSVATTEAELEAQRANAEVAASAKRNVVLRLGDVVGNGITKAEWRFTIVSDKEMSLLLYSALERYDSAVPSEDKKTLTVVITSSAGREGVRFYAPPGAKLTVDGTVKDVKNPNNKDSLKGIFIVGAEKSLYMKPLASKVQLLLSVPGVPVPKALAPLEVAGPGKLSFDAKVGEVGKANLRISNKNHNDVNLDFSFPDMSETMAIIGSSANCHNAKKLAANQTCTLHLQFKPTNGEEIKGFFKIGSSYSKYDSSGSEVSNSIELTAKGTALPEQRAEIPVVTVPVAPTAPMAPAASAGPARIRLNGTMDVNFGAVPVGSFATILLPLANTGGTSTVISSMVNFTSPVFSFNGDGTLIGSGGSCVSYTFAPGTICYVSLRFTPTAGDFANSIFLNYDSGTSYEGINLRGKGI